jgi:hypothetical protein
MERIEVRAVRGFIARREHGVVFGRRHTKCSDTILCNQTERSFGIKTTIEQEDRRGVGPGREQGAPRGFGSTGFGRRPMNGAFFGAEKIRSDEATCVGEGGIMEHSFGFAGGAGAEEAKGRLPGAHPHRSEGIGRSAHREVQTGPSAALAPGEQERSKRGTVAAQVGDNLGGGRRGDDRGGFGAVGARDDLAVAQRRAGGNRDCAELENRNKGGVPQRGAREH